MSKVKGGESECFRIDSGVRQAWLFYVYMNAVMKEVKIRMRRMSVYEKRSESQYR